MSLYEHIMIIRPDISTSQVTTLTEEFIGIVQEQDGVVSKTEYWGRRALAYPVKKKRKAYYVLLNITASHQAITEMERRMRFRDDILRFLTLKVDLHEEEPSIVMRSQALRDAAEADSTKDDDNSSATTEQDDDSPIDSTDDAPNLPLADEISQPAMP